MKRRDTRKLGKPDKSGKKNWNYKTLPLVNSDTVVHDVGGFDLGDVYELLRVLRDRSAIVRIVWRSLENEYYNARSGEQERTGGTVPTDISDMDDGDLWDWLMEVLAGGARRAMYVYEQDGKKWRRK